MKKILALVKDEVLMQKIRLALFGQAEIYAADRIETERADLVIRESSGALFLGDARLSLPLSLSELRRAVYAVEASETPKLSLDPESRCAIFGGEITKLTDAEFRLLSVLAEAGGEFVSRKKILSEVWGGEAGSGVVNVYVHYLREKLERGGVKLIFSSRAEGYRIERRYLTGANNN